MRTDTVVPSRDARRVLADLQQSDGFPTVLEPPIPERVIVRESRAARTWWGSYPAGAVVADAYRAIADSVLAS